MKNDPKAPASKEVKIGRPTFWSCFGTLEVGEYCDVFGKTMKQANGAKQCYLRRHPDPIKRFKVRTHVVIESEKRFVRITRTQ